jgi:hypothetical protein
MALEYELFRVEYTEQRRWLSTRVERQTEQRQSGIMKRLSRLWRPADPDQSEH